MSSVLRLFAVAIVLGAAAGGAALGADKVPAGSGPRAGEKPILTPAQLKECLDQKARLKAQEEQGLKGKVELDAGKAELERSGKALADELTTLDRTNADATAAYNARVGERNAAVDRMQARVETFNKGVDELVAARDAYARACENRRYDERDLDDLNRKRR